jgi:hypothetical protein
MRPSAARPPAPLAHNLTAVVELIFGMGNAAQSIATPAGTAGHGSRAHAPQTTTRTGSRSARSSFETIGRVARSDSSVPPFIPCGAAEVACRVSMDGAGGKPDPVWRRGGAGGGTRTPTGIAALRIFLPATAFAASPPGAWRRVCGLDYPFTVLRRGRSVGAARLVSTPSPSGRAMSRPTHRGLGSGLPWDEVSPSLGSSASGVSPGALKSNA